MRKFLLLCLLFYVSNAVFAQNKQQFDSTALQSVAVYDIVDEAATPKGGMPAYYRFIGENLEYPYKSIKRGASGTVYVRFVITANGEVDEVEVLRGVDPDLDAEAVRIMQLSGHKLGWIPAKVNGAMVSSRKVFPVKFYLTSSAPTSKEDIIQAIKEHPVVTEKTKSLVVDSLEGKPVYVNPDCWPVMHGNAATHSAFLEKHLKFPEAAHGTTGEVSISFTVTAPKGEIRDMKVNHALHPVLDEEALRIVTLMNKEFGWKPGTIQGKKVHSRIIFPILFGSEVHNKEADSVVSLGRKDSLDVQNIRSIDDVDEPATPRLGGEELNRTLSENINYPREAIKSRVMGVTHVLITVNEEGEVEDAEIVKGRELGFGMDEEAIRIAKLTKWNPAKHQGQPVKQRIIMPVKFQLSK